MIANELYFYFIELRNCYIPTFILIILVSVAFVWNCWRNMILMGDSKTTFLDYFQIVIGLFIIAICGFSILGFLLATEQFEKIYDLLGLTYYLDKLAYIVQKVLLRFFELLQKF